MRWRNKPILLFIQGSYPVDTKQRRYKVVDAFTSQPLLGNPVALDAEDLGTETWPLPAGPIYPRTTFLLPPTTAKAD